MTAPGRSHLGPAIDRFDVRADAALERLRGRAGLDALFRVASEAGDFSAVWHLLNLGRWLVVRRPDQLAALAVGLGLESLVVNQGVKRLFRRDRPTTDGDSRTPVRRPRTSSFPSGHASAAAFNAMVLTGWDPRRAPLWWGVAAVVGTSRAHVRIHHASDVVAGAAVGVVFGLAALRVAARIDITR
ncbi:MAG: phosphatase PAP2 family protein [Ilumatobacteraceae bacterium]